MADEKSAGESIAAITAANIIVPFKRRFVMPGVTLGILELLAIAWPIWSTFELGELGVDTLVRTLLPVAVGAAAVWVSAMAIWFAPLWQAVALRRRGERVSKELAARAYRITLKGPVRVLLLRTMVWTT
ncbi:MAG TPA: hypothetical protein VGC41_09135, partial [Kofleriaceae bacterium]